MRNSNWGMRMKEERYTEQYAVFEDCRTSALEILKRVQD